jgi:hypothetical protein
VGAQRGEDHRRVGGEDELGRRRGALTRLRGDLLEVVEELAEPAGVDAVLRLLDADDGRAGLGPERGQERQDPEGAVGDEAGGEAFAAGELEVETEGVALGDDVEGREAGDEGDQIDADLAERRARKICEDDGQVGRVGGEHLGAEPLAGVRLMTASGRGRGVASSMGKKALPSAGACALGRRGASLAVFSPEYGGAAFLGHARAPTESAVRGTRVEYSTGKKALPSAWANRGAARALLAKVPSGPWSCLDLLAL